MTLWTRKDRLQTRNRGGSVELAFFVEHSLDPLDSSLASCLMFVYLSLEGGFSSSDLTSNLKSNEIHRFFLQPFNAEPHKVMELSHRKLRFFHFPTWKCKLQMLPNMLAPDVLTHFCVHACVSWKQFQSIYVCSGCSFSCLPKHAVSCCLVNVF